ncbi:MAG: nucleotide exchange factor GrpE [Microthrixaceae bacterium]
MTDPGTDPDDVGPPVSESQSTPAGSMTPDEAAALAAIDEFEASGGARRVLSTSANDTDDPDGTGALGLDPASGLPFGDHSLVGLDEGFDRVAAERDEYLDMARRVQAEFENYKRRVEGQRVEQVQRAAEALVVELLPVLDACDAAIAHGSEDVDPISKALFNALERKGLVRVDEADVPFDPNLHDAVLSEEGDGGEPVVAEVMRPGYSWNGRVVRPAMVKVRS